MDATDAISYLAEAEGAKVHPVREEEAQERLAGNDMMAHVPYIKIVREADGRLRASGHAHLGHDNESRMPFLLDWLHARVLPWVDPEVDVTGCYRIELHDSYSYLPTRGVYDNVLTFARPMGARERVGLVPDPYQVQGYGGAASVLDAVPWAQKQPTLFFAGTTTGDRDPARNARIRACVWALDQPRDVARFTITSVAQMHPQAVLAAVPRFREVIGPYVPLHEHHRYRYQVNLAGNTACWSRVPMVLASGSVLVHVRHPDALWYYPLLRDGEHYVGVDGLGDLLRVRTACEADPARCQRIVQAGNAFVSAHLQPRHADAYMAQFLEAAAWQGRW